MPAWCQTPPPYFPIWYSNNFVLSPDPVGFPSSSAFPQEEEAPVYFAVCWILSTKCRLIPLVCIDNLWRNLPWDVNQRTLSKMIDTHSCLLRLWYILLILAVRQSAILFLLKESCLTQHKASWITRNALSRVLYQNSHAHGMLSTSVLWGIWIYGEKSSVFPTESNPWVNPPESVNVHF